MAVALMQHDGACGVVVRQYDDALSCVARRVSGLWFLFGFVRVDIRPHGQKRRGDIQGS